MDLAAGVVAEGGSGRPTTLRRTALVVMLAVLPLPGLLGLRSSIRTAGLDPSFYLGLVTQYEAMRERFGQTYHGNRISYVLVDRAFFEALGPVPGFLAARYLMLVLGVTAAHALGRRLGGPAAGVLIAGLVALTPWLPRQLLWTHYDGFAAVYLLVGTALLAVPVRRRWRAAGELAAGAAFALAVNTNLSIAAVVAVTGLGWWALRWEPGRGRRLILPSLRLVGGFFATSGVLALVLRAIFPAGEAFPELVALRVGLAVLGTDSWFVPLRELGPSLLHLVPVPALAAALAVMLLRTRDQDQDPSISGHRRMALITIGGVAAFAAVLHLGFRSAWLSLPYYTIQLLPGVVHGLAVLCGPPLRSAAPLTRWRIVAGVLVAALVLMLTVPVAGALATTLVALTIVAASALPARVIGGPRRGAVAVAASGTLLGLAVSPWHAGTAGSTQELAAARAVEWDVFHHSIALAELIEAHVGTDEHLRFWHTLEGPEGELLTRLNMVYYGTGDGRLHRKGTPGMPVLDDGQVRGLQEGPPIALVLLAVGRDALNEGAVALGLLEDVRLGVRAAASLDGDALDVEVLILTVE